MRVAGILLALAMSVSGMTHTLAAERSIKDLERFATYIFEASVLQKRASNLAGVPVTDSTLVVRVESVLRAPPVVGNLRGRELTILVHDPRSLAVQQRAVFFAGAWVAGTHLGLIEVGRLAPAPHNAIGIGITNAAQERADEALRQRLLSAALVVVGRVASASPISRKRTLSGEHDPQWWEAQVAITSLEKGSWSRDTVAVAYPHSHDVLWYRVEKFEPPKKGIWILHREHIQSRPDSVLTALDPVDFLVPSEIDRVRRLLRSKP